MVSLQAWPNLIWKRRLGDKEPAPRMTERILFDYGTFIKFTTFQLFLACGPILKCTKVLGQVIYFLIFMSDLKKVIKVNFKVGVQIN